MLLKPRVKNKLYDFLHHGVVYVCMSVTVVGTGYLGYLGYKYITDVRPKLKAEQLKAIKQEENVDAAKSIST